MNLFKNILSILTRAEKKRFYTLLMLESLINILDVFFLVALLFVIGYYTNTYYPESMLSIPITFFDNNPLVLIAAFFLLFSLKNLFSYLITKSQFRFIYAVASRISTDNYKKYLDSDYLDYVSIDSSVHIRKINQQPIEFAYHVLRSTQLIISSVFLLFIIVLPVIFLNSTLFLLLLLVLLPPVILTMVLTKKKLSRIRTDNVKNREKTIQHLQEGLEGFIEINLWKMNAFFVDRYSKFQKRFNQSLSDLQIAQSIPSKLMEVFAVFGLFMLVTATTFFETGSVHVLLIGGFMAGAYKVIPGVVKILNSREQIRTYQFTIDELLDRNIKTTSETVKVNETVEALELQGICFSYNGLEVLRDFSLKIGKGDFIGLKGMSGAGKTTVLHILMGFLQPASGKILINNSIVDSKTIKAWWERISYSRQQAFFIHDSIKANILFDLDFEKEKFDHIIRVTGLEQLIEEHPQGMDTIVSENGKNISGGQQQRIIMARTLYKQADLIILDEPFNELDRLAAYQLLLHLQSLAMSGKMIILVTHDEQSLAFCNKIILLTKDF